MKKRSLIIVLLEPVYRLLLKAVILTILIVTVAASVEKIFDIPVYSNMAYVANCYIQKASYVLSNLERPAEVNLYNYVDNKLAADFYDNADIVVLNKKAFNEVIEKYFPSKDNRPSSAIGLCIHDENKIYLLDKGPIYNYSLTLIHEYAHYIAWEKDYASDKNFDVIADREMQQFSMAVPYTGKSIEEYKAETFAYYILLPEMLRKMAPDTYEYHNEKYQELINES